jgi:uncharacterized circularly permuted ATP-grasp superfamily protein/uncharacterized alpha-E superfamily protein
MTTIAPESPAAPPASLFGAYRPLLDCYDEMVLPDGTLRPHWRAFASKMDAVGPDELARQWEQGQRLIYDNGVTFSTVDESGRSTRPWQLDAVPLLLAADEWGKLAAGLEQRARLLNAILVDLYGPQELIQRRLLPPEFVFANPGFQRPLHLIKVPENRFLQQYAAEVARAPDGGWWVVGDQTGSPGGAGYALENRIVTSRMLPDVLRECRVERLATYFIALRESLQQVSPRYRDNPRIVLLTRGPGSLEYFEDAYLARYLGYTLVEGGDLAVRNNQVMLKTLGGLLPVEVILRRPHDDECDPVELRGDSAFGIAGLLEVIRAGNVVVANALGSGILESPLLPAFLPALCRHVLGEELRIPSVATWWCGEEPARKYVLDHLDSLTICPAFDSSPDRASRPKLLSKDERQKLIDAIRNRPAEFVARETVRRSTAPVLTDDGLKPWHLSVRTFLVARNDGYAAMPGGLIRVSAPGLSSTSTARDAERSQDAWVLAKGPVPHVSLLPPPGESVKLRRSGAELPSRVADNLFWLGRYTERSEGSVRLLRSVLSRLTGETEFDELPELPVLLRCLASLGQLEPGFVVEGIRDQLPMIDEALPDAVFNEQEDRSLRSSINRLRNVAGLVRDRISLDVWRIITRIDQDMKGAVRRRTSGDVLDLVNQLVIDLSAFSGLVGESMTRTLGWRFLEIGRRIERSLHTAALLRSAVVERESPEPPVLEAALEVADSLMTYRSRYLAHFQVGPLLDLLLLDETNPRSVGYQLAALYDHVCNLPSDPGNPARAPHERLAMSLLHSVRMVEVEQLAAGRSNSAKEQLDRLLSRITEQLPKVAEAISHRYLIHAGAPRQFSGSGT